MKEYNSTPTYKIVSNAACKRRLKQNCAVVLLQSAQQGQLFLRFGMYLKFKNGLTEAPTAPLVGRPPDSIGGRSCYLMRVYTERSALNCNSSRNFSY